MNKKTRSLIKRYVHENIDAFHKSRLDNIQGLKLNQVLANKNPYLFRAKNLNQASHLITALLDARLSSSEEGSFGGFLEDLAIFVAQITGGGQKSSSDGIDIDVTRNKIRYLIAVKSGRNWGNAGQHKDLRACFKRAVKVLKQSKHVGTIQPTLGICYGKFKTVDNGLYLHIGGQSFWHLISGDRDLYVDLIEPLGHEAEAHAEKFGAEKDATYNRMTDQFMERFCDANYYIDWPKLVRFVSENMPLKERAPFIDATKRARPKK
jgi:Type II restriction endonuclease EcoO109I